MDLNICHLYPDLLNVYGDVGNILILKHRAELRGIKVNILNNSLNDAFDVDNYDIVLLMMAWTMEMWRKDWRRQYGSFSKRAILFHMKMSASSTTRANKALTTRGGTSPST